MKAPRLICFVFLLCSIIRVNAQTNVSGGIYSNTNWPLANSPYIITSTVVVFPGVKLTIEPGVLIMVNNGQRLEVRGELVAHGNVSDTITFMSSSATPNIFSWNGVYIASYQGGKGSIRYCKIKNADKGYAIDFWSGAGGPFLVSNCLFTDNNIGVGGNSGYNQPMYIDSSTFMRNSYGVFDGTKMLTNSIFLNNPIGAHFGGGKLDNCRFEYCSSYAICTGTNITRCVIRHNDAGILFPSATVSMNIIAENTVGIRVNNNATVFSNTICGNYYGVENMYSNNITGFQNNCWCLNDSASISQTIKDGYDDASRGLVSFMPFYTGCLISNGISPNDLMCINEFKAVPNPFSSRTDIRFSLSSDAKIAIDVFDVVGKHCGTLLNENLAVGEHSVRFNSYNSGMYFVVMKVNGEATATLKVIAAP